MPRPDEGWSTYHPPLYYALVAELRELFGGTPRAERVATKVPSFLAGLGTVWVSFGLARALLPLRPELVAVAVLFAGVLPLDVYTLRLRLERTAARVPVRRFAAALRAGAVAPEAAVARRRAASAVVSASRCSRR